MSDGTYVHDAAGKMSSTFVYIAYAMDDSSEVAAIADAVRDAGWSVCFGHLAEPGMDDSTLNLTRLNSASSVLVVWSSNAASSSVVRSDALEAARQHKLVLVSLDDAASPVPGQTRLPLQDWFAGLAPRAINNVIDEIVRRGGRGEKGRGGIVPYVARQRSRPGWFVAGGAALGVIVLSITIAAIWPTGHRLASTGQAPAAASTPQEVSSASSMKDLLAAMNRWALIPQDDLPAIRGFISEHQGTRAAEGAMRVVQKLEQSAWLGIFEHDDIPTQLDAITNFRIDFPDGVYAFQANSLENKGRDALYRIDEDLRSLGFMPPTGPGDVETMRASVRAFERSVGLTPSGRLTENLSVLLAVAVENNFLARER